MAEAVIVIPILILIDAALLFLFDGYRGKLAVMREVHQQVWLTATNGCGGGGESSLAPIGGSLATAKKLAKGPSLERPLSTGLDLTSSSSSRAVRGTWWGDVHPSARGTVICNEMPSDVSQADVKKTIDSLYAEWF